MKSKDNGPPKFTTTVRPYHPNQQKSKNNKTSELWFYILALLGCLIMAWLMISKGWKSVYELDHLNQGFLVTEATVIERERTTSNARSTVYLLHYEYTLQPENQPPQTFTGYSSVPELKYRVTKIGDQVTIIYAKSDISVSQIKRGAEIRGSYSLAWFKIIGVGGFFLLAAIVFIYAIIRDYFRQKRQKVEP